MSIKKYLSNILYSIDQLVNTLLGGYSDETISARSYRLSKSYYPWFIIMNIINCVFFNKNHCKHAYEHEIDLPVEYVLANKNIHRG